MTIAMTDTVITPQARTTLGVCFATWCWKVRMTRKRNQATPLAAVPEWIPPMCWTNAVRKMRHQSGVHCNLDVS